MAHGRDRRRQRNYIVSHRARHCTWMIGGDARSTSTFTFSIPPSSNESLRVEDLKSIERSIATHIPTRSIKVAAVIFWQSDELAGTRCSSVLTTEHARKASAIYRDGLQHLTSLANARAAFIRNIGVPNFAFRIGTHPVRRHPPSSAHTRQTDCLVPSRKLLPRRNTET